MSKKQISAAKHWVFTWNNYPENACEIISAISARCARIVCQCEVAPTTGTKHVQGYIEFRERVRPASQLPKGIHWEKCKSFEKAMEYCQKDSSRDPDGWRYVFPQPIRTINFLEFFPWQREIYNIYRSEPDDRKIYWYWEANGGVGKTAFIKYMVATFDDCVYSCATRAADILTVAETHYKMYLLNFTRDAANNGFSPWAALEQLKDGLVSDSKLKKKSRNIIFNAPHIIVFANWQPDVGHLSADRLTVRNII